MKKLEPTETDLVGAWLESPDGFEADETARRISWLTESVLQKVADSPRWGGWQTLFRDPADFRLWEMTYPDGDRHGGGPPRLRNLSMDEAVTRYGADVVR